MKTTNKIDKIFKILNDFYKEKENKLELNFIDPFTLLIAVMLSAQATDKRVNIITEKLFKVAKTPEDFVKLGERKLKEYIKSINYFNMKAKHIIEMCKAVIEKFNSKVPMTMEELTSLSGVGRKTASCILVYAFKIPAIPVDTHVFRVSNRLGLVKETTPQKTEKSLLKIIPKKYMLLVNEYFVLLGRYICQARCPKCQNCPIKDYCEFYKGNKVEK